MIAKAVGQMGEGAEGLEERHHPRVTEAQRRDPLAVFDGGALQPVQGLSGQHAVVTHPFHFEELPIHLVSELAQV